MWLIHVYIHSRYSIEALNFQYIQADIQVLQNPKYEGDQKLQHLFLPIYQTKCKKKNNSMDNVPLLDRLEGQRTQP